MVKKKKGKQTSKHSIQQIDCQIWRTLICVIKVFHPWFVCLHEWQELQNMKEVLTKDTSIRNRKNRRKEREIITQRCEISTEWHKTTKRDIKWQIWTMFLLIPAFYFSYLFHYLRNSVSQYGTILLWGTDVQINFYESTKFLGIQASTTLCLSLKHIDKCSLCIGIFVENSERT